MRIWILTCELAHEGPGGIARYVENFAKLIGAAGHEITIIGRAQSDYDVHPSPGVRIIGFEHRWSRLGAAASSRRPDDHPSYPYNVIGYAQALSHEIADRVLELLERLPRPDVIESHEYMALPYYLLHRKLTQRTRLDDIPILVHMHGPLHELLRVNQEPRFRFPAWWTGQMEKACVAMADALLSPSQFLADRIRGILGPAFTTPIAQIPYPVGDGADSPFESPEPGEILYVGRLQLLKGVLPMLAACSRMWAAGRQFRLTLIGGDTIYTPRNCTMREYIVRKHARWIDAGRLVLPGPMPYEQVLARLRRSWAAMIPSLWENFPNVCIEAMMSGTVAVGSTSGGQAEMIHRDGENGFLFDWDTPGDFERTMDRVLGLDVAERRRIVERAKKRIHEICSADVVVQRRIEHYEQVARNQQPRHGYPSLQQLQRARLPEQKAPIRASWQAPAPAAPPRDDVRGLLSVVIPFFNLGAYVRETIDSILKSAYQPTEIILVNDGSTDRASLEVLAQLERERIAGLQIVHTENSGLAQTRNNGADHARGEFLCFLDADDCVEPDYFTRCIDVLTRHDNVDFVSSWIRYFGETHEIWPVFNAGFPYLLGHNMCTAFSVIRRRSFERWGRNKPVVEYALEDHEMWISMLEAGAVGVALPDPLVRYRVRKGSMLQSSTEVQQMYLFDVISQLHPELYREFGVELFNLQNANGPGRLWNHPALDLPQSWGPRPAAQAPQESDGDGQAAAPEPVAPPLEQVIPAEALDELRRIEQSRSWTLVQRMKGTVIYRAFARARWGDRWEHLDDIEDPAARLDHIKNSNAYRLIEAVKRTSIYRWYAKRKYGDDFAPRS
ncbi:MAG: glycosyltransferase [Planctomycetes bacterium]|nr:glycosyltransferase [Planctomycetota bacterium]